MLRRGGRGAQKGCLHPFPSYLSPQRALWRWKHFGVCFAICVSLLNQDESWARTLPVCLSLSLRAVLTNVRARSRSRSKPFDNKHFSSLNKFVLIPKIILWEIVSRQSIPSDVSGLCLSLPQTDSCLTQIHPRRHSIRKRSLRPHKKKKRKSMILRQTYFSSLLSRRQGEKPFVAVVGSERGRQRLRCAICWYRRRANRN